MEFKEDKRGVLREEVFTYHITKDKKIFIYWNKKQVKILSGKDADKFLAKINHADSYEKQLIMAKYTGNFKRGNEKQRKNG